MMSQKTNPLDWSSARKAAWRGRGEGWEEYGELSRASYRRLAKGPNAGKINNRTLWGDTLYSDIRSNHVSMASGSIATQV